MLIWENIRLALTGLVNNKMRSLLTMLGIIIGIGSVIAIMTVSSSLTTSITDTFAEMGANNVTVGLQQQSEEEETRSNKGYYDANDITLLAGRYLTEKDVSGSKSVIMVSDKVVDNVFDGNRQSALGQSVQVDINHVFYRFYIVGVYEYQEDASSFSSDAAEDVTTAAYIPITRGKEMLHTDEGYERFTIAIAFIAGIFHFLGQSVIVQTAC